MDESDLRGFDKDAQMMFSRIQHVFRLESQGGPYLSEILDEISSNLFWVTKISDGTLVELHARGGLEPVSISDVPELIRKCILCRMYESEYAMLAMRDGLSSIIPACVLHLLNWNELEQQVCGTRGVDLALLQQNTEYDDDIRPDDRHILFFWEALHSFTDYERSIFLRFVWARARLPLAKNLGLAQKFKIQAAVGDGPRDDPDKYLPKAHTCFFSLNLPRYTSSEIMTSKLRYAIFNCIEMDADFKLADTELAGWS